MTGKEVWKNHHKIFQRQVESKTELPQERYIFPEERGNYWWTNINNNGILKNNKLVRKLEQNIGSK